MKKILVALSLFLMSLTFMFVPMAKTANQAFAKDTPNKYFAIYDCDNRDNIIFVRGDGVEDGDSYISGDNKLYEIVEVDENNKMAYAKFIEDVKMPVYNAKKKNLGDGKKVADAATKKIVGLYHTHNDESYIINDGVDSVYGKGGIHDVGKKFKENLNALGIEVAYSEDLHLPHNSGAYTRSQVTASKLIEGNKLDALFDVHRDSTPAKYYETTVDGVKMSMVRMVVGKGNQNSNENLEFAKSIKAYADEVYPGLIKDIYMGKGNYNQQLTPRAMLFEMGSEQVDKNLVLKSCEPLAKTLDVVLFGSKNASEQSLNDVSLVSSNGKEAVITGLAYNQSTASVSFVWVLLAGIAFYFIVLGIVCIFSKQVRYKTARFFSELFGGLFGKKKTKKHAK